MRGAPTCAASYGNYVANVFLCGGESLVSIRSQRSCLKGVDIKSLKRNPSLVKSTHLLRLAIESVLFQKVKFYIFEKRDKSNRRDR